MLQLLKKNLRSAQNRITQVANKRSERSFNMGDWVYLKSTLTEIHGTEDFTQVNQLNTMVPTRSENELEQWIVNYNCLPLLNPPSFSCFIVKET